MGNFYIGRKPCPGCNRPVQESPRSKADQCCWECQKLLRLGKSVKENSGGFSRIKLAKYAPGTIFVTADKTDTKEAVFERHDRPAYIPDSGKYEGSSRQLMNAVEKLVKLLDEGAKDKYELDVKMKEAWEDVYSVRTTTALAVVALLDAVRDYGNRREAEGYENGQKLLTNLCTGALTIDEFNRRSVGKIREGE